MTRIIRNDVINTHEIVFFFENDVAHEFKCFFLEKKKKIVVLYNYDDNEVVKYRY